ncbi:inorganic phosphate transporter [Tenacibaculum singaporense]|uniref:Phosphate transporter n=1 Tax=Tenacibaculum singaporense TaxID=2358479 RepID=A0A3Q8RQB2_9FLAO|nr:inorganic phosphate transporter [Tenacibaculum singaporense]AZJ34189.1 inorganic phosphate transporter [Tenacibaculum singaporense]RSC95582.1 inorganic phosphate transporter [Tenacibaculum singaporense]
MENIYLIMIVALVVLAIADLVVGVSNDAVNFLNSAIGSKAIPFKTIMIVASLGIFCGAVFSSGMMEVARKGIFVPGEFMFNEIMIIFMAVMITDILLLDFFNTLGMPTSTTVSIVFELLGAAVTMALIKIGASDSQTFSDLLIYINTEKAFQIISGILLSVIIAFSVGALVQYVSRLIFSFHYDKKIKYLGALFGGGALTAITYFIFMKGLKGTPYYKDIKGVLEGNEIMIIFISFIALTILSQIYMSVLKKNIFIPIIAIGTFGLALAFAGNDLVNFIGVPMAAWHSYEAWTTSGIDATAFSMEALDKKVPTEPLLLFLAGGIMVLTLWFSKKARSVADTEIGLSRQGEGAEKFKPNTLSRSVVRFTILVSKYTNTVLPTSVVQKIDKQFQKPVITVSKSKSHELPAFDQVRASVNLMVAGVLISIATSMKLPLSTTYVTFMVAMGTSLADRAWGSESAVYRVAGVFNVIGGWFGTAIIAFIAAGIMALLINLGGPAAIAVLLLLAILLLARNYIAHNEKTKELKAEDRLSKAEGSSIQGVIEESADNISKALKRVCKINDMTIKGLINQDLALLKKARNNVNKLEAEIEDLQSEIFYFIKELDDSYLRASKFYIDVTGSLQDLAQSSSLIAKISHKHVNNNHKALKKKQAAELLDINNKLIDLLNVISKIFDSRSFEKIVPEIVEGKVALLNHVEDSIQLQVERTRTEESSPKNATLYFSILLETKDLIKSNLEILNLYYEKNEQLKN